VAELNTYHREGKAGGEMLNLEKQFVARLQDVGGLLSPSPPGLMHPPPQT
jgi:hypothetical protein